MQDSLPIQRVVVIGTGMMGPGIALAFATAGKTVVLAGRSQESLARGLSTLEAGLRTLQDAELLSPEEASLARGRVEGTADLPAAASTADVVVESIVEDLPTKQALFAQLDRLCPPQALITSNTSGLPISRITAEMSRPERAATTHFWMPPHLIPLVEIVRGERTSEDTVLRLRALLTQIGKRPVVVRRDVPGQLGNRLLGAITREAMAIVQEGIATAEEVDTAIKTGLGLRFPVYGPLEHADMVGLDLVLSVHSYLLQDLCNSPEPLAILREKAARGELGARAGRGFYDWSKKSPDEVKATRDAFILARLKDLYPPKAR
ncbi:MAG: 3-hydroxyacyl-CoA dehydrogenase family protein [Sphingomonadaceae bacterium]